VEPLKDDSEECDKSNLSVFPLYALIAGLIAEIVPDEAEEISTTSGLNLND